LLPIDVIRRLTHRPVRASVRRPLVAVKPSPPACAPAAPAGGRGLQGGVEIAAEVVGNGRITAAPSRSVSGRHAG
jgi:hypothetical protein